MEKSLEKNGINSNKTYSTILKLISGALVGGINYSEIYDMCGIDMDDTSTTGDNTSSNTDKEGNNNQHSKIPTLQKVARKVARLEKMELDEKQYIAYVMIACTFLLGLVRDGNNSNTTLFTSLQKTIGGETSQEIADIVRKLEARGGQQQLLLFLTGPAGSGKSTALRVAEQFCYEFCMAVGIMWGDRTLLFTVYTGSAASLIGGVTISKAAYLNLQRQLNDNDINEWKDVKILVIDEVSFMSDSTFKKFNRQLTQIGNRTNSFGGFSIIFAGDFHQLEPICSTDSELLFSSKSSQEWDSNINAIIILDNEHRFKEDVEYGKMLKRMWEGDLTIEDNQRINTRVIGQNGNKVPHMLQGKCKIIQVQNNLLCVNIVNLLAFTCLLYQIKGDTCYACPTNSERNSIQASIFKKHILATHPSIHNEVNPLEHTIIIEADISSSIAKKAHRKINKHTKHKIITT
jgi:hypothetical protein